MARITRMTKRRLGELLQAEGLITEDQVKAGLDEQRKSNLFLGEALVKLGFVSEEAIAHTIVQQFSLPFMSAMQYNITPDVLNTFPERMYYEYQFLAVDKIGKVLIIIGAGLMNHDVLDELERLSGCKVCQFVSTWKDIRSCIEKYAKDIKKDQSDLTSLGSLLLDSGVSGTHVKTGTAVVPKPAVATKPAATTPVPGAAPAQPAAGASFMRPALSASAQAAPQPAAASETPAPAPPDPKPVLSSTSGGPKTAFTGGQRISALTRPAGTSSQAMPKVQTVNPNVPPPAPAAGQAGANPPASKSNGGLLGLFKKP